MQEVQRLFNILFTTWPPDSYQERPLPFDEFMGAFRRQLEYFLKMKMEANNVIGRLYADRLPAPFMSVLVDDCIKSGLDYCIN